jgi:hypothetical protein
MKAEIKAGAQIELLTRSELREEFVTAMTAWRQELARGVKFRKFSATATVVGGEWAVGGGAASNEKQTLGPEPGFMWSLTSLAVNGSGYDTSSDDYNLYSDAVQPSKFILTIFGYGDQWDPGVIVLTGPEQLAFAGVGTGTDGDQIHIAGRAIEVPVQQGWRLI